MHAPGRLVDAIEEHLMRLQLYPDWEADILHNHTDRLQLTVYDRVLIVPGEALLEYISDPGLNRDTPELHILRRIEQRWG